MTVIALVVPVYTMNGGSVVKVPLSLEAVRVYVDVSSHVALFK